jgi:5-keto 4-deoxyuronate isomerase
MGFSRKEVYYWLETASDEQLQHMLGTSKEMLSMLTDPEQVTSLKWLRAKVIEEINARREAKQD